MSPNIIRSDVALYFLMFIVVFGIFNSLRMFFFHAIVISGSGLFSLFLLSLLWSDEGDWTR